MAVTVGKGVKERLRLSGTEAVRIDIVSMGFLKIDHKKIDASATRERAKGSDVPNVVNSTEVLPEIWVLVSVLVRLVKTAMNVSLGWL